MSLGVCVVGCGLIGRKRAAQLAGGHLVSCADTEVGRAEALARQHSGAVAFADPLEAIEHPGVDVVVVATDNAGLAPLAVQALDRGRHVLIEKPGARSAAELRGVEEAAARAGRHVRVGFNHRYHPALLKARTLIDDGAIGPLMFLRGRYGHGGRVGYDREWRADPARSGGGELMDQGVHLIDLARWFLGDFHQVSGFAHTYFWQMPVDDNAFLTLRTATDQVAFLHVSCSEWKNLFSLEIYGRVGKLQIDGLGGSYGIEKLTLYQMLPEMGPPDTTSWEYPRGDNSWALEMQAFAEDLRLDRCPEPGVAEALSALSVVEEVYRQSAASAPFAGDFR